MLFPQNHLAQKGSTIFSSWVHASHDDTKISVEELKCGQEVCQGANFTNMD